MIPRLLALLSPLLIAGLSAAPEPFTTFANGETFRYRVGWGIFTRAGEITIAAHQDLHDAAGHAHHHGHVLEGIRARRLQI